MSANPQAIETLIEAELRSLKRDDVGRYIRGLLVRPTEVVRAWDYGAPGEAYLTWTVLEHRNSNTGVAYCEQGFGPRSPWGLVLLGRDAALMSLGMDSAWFTTFLQAFFESRASIDLPIWRVYETDATGGCAAISDEGSWEKTWATIRRLRIDRPEIRVECWHDVEIERE